MKKKELFQPFLFTSPALDVAVYKYLQFWLPPTPQDWLISRFSVCVCVLVTQLCPTLCNTMDCSPPGSSVHGIVQVRTPEQVAIPFSRGSSIHKLLFEIPKSLILLLIT